MPASPSWPDANPSSTRPHTTRPTPELDGVRAFAILVVHLSKASLTWRGAQVLREPCVDAFLIRLVSDLPTLAASGAELVRRSSEDLAAIESLLKVLGRTAHVLLDSGRHVRRNLINRVFTPRQPVDRRSEPCEDRILDIKAPVAVPAFHDRRVIERGGSPSPRRRSARS
jgi:hypothetical protein